MSGGLIRGGQKSQLGVLTGGGGGGGSEGPKLKKVRVHYQTVTGVLIRVFHILYLVMEGGASVPVTSAGMSSYLSKLIPAAIVANIWSSSSGGGGGI